MTKTASRKCKIFSAEIELVTQLMNYLVVSGCHYFREMNRWSMRRLRDPNLFGNPSPNYDLLVRAQATEFLPSLRRVAAENIWSAWK